MITLAVSLAVEQACSSPSAPNTATCRRSWTSKVTIGGVDIGGQRLLALGVGVLVLIVLWLFIQRTRLGAAILAVSQDPEAAQYMGIPINRIFSVVMAISAGARRNGRHARLSVSHGAAGHGAAADGQGVRDRDRRRARLDSGQHPCGADARLLRNGVAYLVSTSWTELVSLGRGGGHADDQTVGISAGGRRSDAANSADRPLGGLSCRRDARAGADVAHQQLPDRCPHRLRDLRHLGVQLGFHVRVDRTRELRPALFIGAGAYTAGFMATVWFLNPWYSLPAAVVVAVLFSLIVGFPTLRLQAVLTSRSPCCRLRRSCSGFVSSTGNIPAARKGSTAWTR